MIHVLGLSGKAGSGKDYIASNYLKPRGWLPFSLAWHFKIWIVGKRLATHYEVFHSKPPHIRKLLQEEGTEFGRDVYGDTIWLDTAYAWMTLFHNQWGVSKFVIPDVRFPNEVEYLQSRGAAVCRVLAPERIRNSSLTTEARLHISETALDDYERFDGYIPNDIGQEAFVERDIDNLLTLFGWR